MGVRENYHLAQINIAYMRAALDDPLMAGFVARLDEINKLADESGGFVWRLQSEDGNNTGLKAYEDKNILVNMSLWESVDSLKAYVYRSTHAELIQRRRDWFSKSKAAYAAMWWVPAGHIPAAEEGMRRLAYLQANGDTPHAFSFKKTYEPIKLVEDGLSSAPIHSAE